MGYRVWVTPTNKRAGYLEFGKVATEWGSGTYYSHPSAAKKAAQSWVSKNQGTAEIQIYRESTVVETFYSK